ncbi:MAG TPA: hypothetical protein VN706_05725 [Gemmatimonadaceae bacterium]|nr:hypothetical protein [Gemmatimonadaceae bacterium]
MRSIQRRLRELAALLMVCGATACGSAMTEQVGVRASGPLPRWADVGRACSDDSPASSLPASENQTYVRGEPDDTWARLARTIPGGFAGLFVDNGQFTYLLVDPGKRSVAEPQLRAAGLPVSSSSVVRQARWDFAQLHDWMGFIERNLRTPSISFDDIDEVNNRLSFGVPDTVALRAFETNLQQLNLPCNLVWVIQQGFATFEKRP